MYSITLEEVQQLLAGHQLLREIILGDQWIYRLTDRALLNLQLQQLDYRSGAITGDALFICKGQRFKEEYLLEAVQKGAKAYVSEVPYQNSTIPGFIVSDIQRTMALLAASFYDNPQKDMTLIGITGTKGKTTTNYFIHHILDEAYPGQTAFASSIDNCLDGKTYEPSNLTTPESLDLFRFFAKARDHGMRYFVMEVSSQSYKMDRVYGLEFDYGIFTNFSPDHIGAGEHSNMEDYFYCKRQFLDHVNWVLLYDQLPHQTLLCDQLDDHNKQYVFYGQTDRGYQIIPSADSKNQFSLINPDGSSESYISPLPGLFNLENATAAVCLAKELNISTSIIQSGLSQTRVEGRMERYELPNGAIAYVDYAHNYDSLKRMAEFVQEEYPDRKSTLVVGAPGGKGFSRRRDFAKIADQYIDRAIFTEDDSNYENPLEIIQEIQSYMEYPEKSTLIVERQAAIEQTIATADRHDVIIIAGKGREQYQKVKGKNVFYQGDAQIVEDYIQRNK